MTKLRWRSILLHPLHIQLAFLIMILCPGVLQVHMFVLGQPWPGYKGHKTDTLTSTGNNSRSGYEDNHNIDPNVLRSGTFNVIWKRKLLGNYNNFEEQIYAQPLVFTPPGGTQRVYVVSQQNIAYILDAVTGAILTYRTLKIPFLVTPDLEGCNDISNCVGSTGTGVIDPETGTWYLVTKTYENQEINTPQGLLQGRHFFYALDVLTLEDRTNFPVPLQGITGDNAPWRMFEGGKHHQRPALLLARNYVYAGFGSHCVQWNFTGWIMGWNKYTGERVAAWAMEGGREIKTGIGGGVWMSGGGLASDNPGRMFFATGNGYASQLADDAIPGRSPPTALEEAVVNMVINDDGSVTPVDFFMPWEKRDLDAMDKDLGTSGFVLLDPGTFQAPESGVRRIGCVAGKTGKLYFLNLEDLGGYQMGSGRKDKVLQTMQMSAPVFASAGSYPLEGGYVYVSPVGKQMVAFKFGKDGSGNPIFTQAGVTTHSAAGRQGVGHGAVTSLNGQPGTGIIWVTDVEGVTLRVYGATPDANGVLPTLLMLNNPGQSKFSRPTFGDGKVYLTTTNGIVTALGSPVNMPFNCSSSQYEAGTVLTGNQSTTEITCITKIALIVDLVELDPSNGVNVNFNLSSLSGFPRSLAQGETFKFDVVFQPVTVGPLSTTIQIRTTNSGSQIYATITPIVIRGVARSLAPILVIQPNVLSFGEFITGSNETSTLDFFLENVGEGNMAVQGYRWSTESPEGPYIFTTPDASGTYNIGPFRITGLPRIGGQVLGNARVLTTVRFAPIQDGSFRIYIIVQTSGGTKPVGAFGTAGSAPQAFFEWKEVNGDTWIPYVPGVPFYFGDVYLGRQEIRTMRLTNKGGTTLTTTISKPPVSGPLAALNGLGSIAEGSQLGPGQSEEAQLVCAPPKGQVNKSRWELSSLWTINNNDPVMGKQVIQFTCSAITPQIGPLNSQRQGRYRYLGCAKDADPDRRMDRLLYYSKENENGKCMNDCFEQGYIFAATEYEGECWCGNTSDSDLRFFPDTACGYLCRGNYTQYCGGDGAYMSLFGDEEKHPAPGNQTSTLTSATGTSSGGVSTSNFPSTSTSRTTISTTTTTTQGATYTPRPNFIYLGCANEPPSGARALPNLSFISSTMTTNACQDFCSSKRYPLSGTEYSTECYCGYTLSPGSTLGATTCTMPCGGAPREICGGPGSLSVFNNTLIRPPVEVPFVGEYISLGCYTEGITGRALTGGMIVRGDMTVEYCVGYCRERGWRYAGVEYGVECFCGERIENGARKAVVGDGGGMCEMICGGDGGEICGGVGRLNVYERGVIRTTATSGIATGTATATVTVPRR